MTEDDGLAPDVREAIGYREAGRIIVADPDVERLHKLLAIAQLGDRIWAEAISPTLCRMALWSAVRAFVETPPKQLPPPTCERCFQPLQEAEDRRRVLQLAGARGSRRQR